jgi:hypothetical protein
MEGPVHMSNVLAHCPTCNRGVRKPHTDAAMCKAFAARHAQAKGKA